MNGGPHRKLSNRNGKTFIPPREFGLITINYRQYYVIRSDLNTNSNQYGLNEI